MPSNSGNGPGRGRYTRYVAPKSARRTFLEKLYKGDGTDFTAVIDSVEHGAPYVGMDQNDAIDMATKNGNQILRGGVNGGIIDGDHGMFPEGFDLKFTGAGAEIQAPDTLSTKDNAWAKAGDAANSYVPDITSPGPGKTDGIEKDINPEIKSSDIKPNYIPGGPGTGTKSPSVTSGKLYDAQTLGGALDKGKSGGDV
jgi:hypothetical protein